MAEKRIIEYEAASELANDDWLLIDGVTEGTRKARPSTVTAELGEQVTNIATAVSGLTQVTMGHEQSFAPSYDESASYDVGDLVMQYHGLYKCTAPTTGTWDAGKWARTEVSEQLEESGKIDDVQVNGVSVVTDKVANIDLTDMQEDIDSKVADATVADQSILDENHVLKMDSLLAKASLPTGAISTIEDGANLPMPSLKVSIEAQQSGTGDPSPTNIRPFTGWSAVNVVRSGINLWDEQWELGSYSTSTGEKTDANNRIRCKNPIKVIGGSTIYISSANENMRIYLYYPNGDYKTTPSVLSDTEYTIPDDVGWITFNMATTYGTTYNNDVSINYPSTDTSYHAYNGTTTSISLGETVYNAELDVINGEGTSGYYPYTFTGNESGGDYYGAGLYLTTGVPTNITQGGMCEFCSMRTTSGNPQVNEGVIANGSAGVGNVAFNLDGITTLAELKTLVAGKKILFKIGASGTPKTFTTTPTQISTMSGTNDLWADSGDVLEGEYYRNVGVTLTDLISRVEALENA